jgi:LEA14-like dessication related protein
MANLTSTDIFHMHDPAYFRSLVFLFAPIVLAGCESVKPLIETAPKPEARIIGAELRNVSLQNADLLFTVEVSNPYAVGLPLLDLSYAIGSNGRNLLEGAVKPTGTVPARGTSVLQLPARLAFASVLETLQGVRPGSVVPYRADITLGVDAPVIGRLALPLSRSGELPVPAVPEVELVAFNIGSLSLDSVEAVARLRVKNTNQFQVDLARFGASLALGGHQIGRTNLANVARVAPGQSATLDVPLAFSPRALGPGVYNLLTGSQANYALSGSIEAGTRFGPISLPYERTGTAPIRK